MKTLFSFILVVFFVRQASAVDNISIDVLPNTISTSSGVTHTVDASGVHNFDFNTESIGPYITITNFPSGLNFSAYPFLIFEGKSSVDVLISRIIFTNQDGQKLTYEPDTYIERIPSRVIMRSNALTSVDMNINTETFGNVNQIQIYFWMPDYKSTFYSLRLSELKFSSHGYSPKPDYNLLSGKPHPKPVHGNPIPFFRRWQNISPGGGGWYRSAEFSPHNNMLLVGGDVAGIFISKDNRTFKPSNTGLMNRNIQSIVFHPNPSMESVIYLGTEGGVARSVDGGLTWSMLRNGFRPIQTFKRTAPVYALTIDQDQPNVMYAGLGFEKSFGNPPWSSTKKLGLVYKSINGGDSWQEVVVSPVLEPDPVNNSNLIEVSAIDDESIMAITIDPNNNQRLFLLSQSRLFSSINSGMNWTQVISSDLPQIKQYTHMVQPESNTLIVTYTNSNQSNVITHETGIIRSLDGGKTWSTVYSDQKTGSFTRLKYYSSSVPTIYAIHSDQGVKASTNMGLTWDAVSINKSLTRDLNIWFGWSERATAFAQDPKDTGTMIYVNDMEIYLTSDNGINWDQMATTYVQPTDGITPDTFQGNGADILVGTNLAVDYSSPSTIYAGYRDATLWKTNDGGASIARLSAGGLGKAWGSIGAVTIDPQYPSIIYVSKGGGWKKQALYRSYDGGKNFELIGSKENNLYDQGQISVVAIDPLSPAGNRTLYAGVVSIESDLSGAGVYKSIDNGETWFTANSGLITGAGSDNLNVSDIKIAVSNGISIIYLCTRWNGSPYERGFIARSSDGGASWSKLIENLDCKTLETDPFDSNILYAGHSDYASFSRDRVFLKSIDGGDTWQGYPGDGIFDQIIDQSFVGDNGFRYKLNSIAADPALVGRIYAAFGGERYDYDDGSGLYYSDNRGETWVPFDTAGLPTNNLSRIIVDPYDTSRLYLLTNGNGLWRYGSPPPPTIDTDNDGIYDNEDNCPVIFNPQQEDTNKNGIGDHCEPTKLSGFWPGVLREAGVGEFIFIFGNNFMLPNAITPNVCYVDSNNASIEFCTPVVQVISDDLLIAYYPGTGAPLESYIKVTAKVNTVNGIQSLNPVLTPTIFGIISPTLSVNGLWPGTVNLSDEISNMVLVFGRDFDPAAGTTQVTINGVTSYITMVQDSDLLITFIQPGMTTGPVCVTVASDTQCSATNLEIVQ